MRVVDKVPNRISDERRFGQRVKVMANGCWAYNGDLERYGEFQKLWFESPLRAHRYAYETLVGPVPAGLVLHHKCQNPGCVNPDHLEPMLPGDHLSLHAELRRRAMP